MQWITSFILNFIHMHILSLVNDFIILVISKTYNNLIPKFVVGLAVVPGMGMVCVLIPDIDWPYVTLGTAADLFPLAG